MPVEFPLQLLILFDFLLNKDRRYLKEQLLHLSVDDDKKFDENLFHFRNLPTTPGPKVCEKQYL